MIHFLTFDIGGVASLTDKDAIVAKGRERWPDFDYAQFGRMMVPHGKRIDKDYWRLIQDGLINPEEYLSAGMCAGKLPDTQKNRDHFRAVLKTFSGNWYSPMLRLVEDLKGNGYHTSILSNNNELLYADNGLVAIVDVSISSHHIHISKPRMKAYELLLQRIGASDPSTVLFTDDKLKNVQGAEDAGINGYLFRSREMPMDEAFGEFVSHLQELHIRADDASIYLQP